MAEEADNSANPGDAPFGGYAESMAELESILAGLESDDVDIDTLASQVERASQLIAHCEGRLRATELSLQTILAQHDSPTDAGEES
ncbi:exodeoxyribonuclease VII small subunit [Candidatus Poriferisodalis sp.]|uniref:exodeoxyribonuclease VII small subunit n=1 Tax=Candidatus Poriferisodalis sp. TaxID=3101277 RepID=UPI003B0244E4